MDVEFMEKVLDLENFIIDEIETDNENLIITGHLQRKEHICPKCNSRVREVKDVRIQKIKDIKAFEKKYNYKIEKAKIRL